MTERNPESWISCEFGSWDYGGEVRLGNKFGSFAVSREEESGKEFWDLGPNSSSRLLSLAARDLESHCVMDPSTIYNFSHPGSPRNLFHRQ